MVTVLKSIAEAVTQLLTLLLQIFVHQLERQEVITETEIEVEPQVQGQLQEMMQQINRGQLLENLKNEIMDQKKTSGRKLPGTTMRSNMGPSAGSASAMASLPASAMASLPSVAVIQRRSKAPSVVSQAAIREEIEEIEEVVIQQNVQVTTLNEQNMVGAPPAPTLPLPGNLTTEEWGNNTIGFGRKHKGKTFETVMRQDPGYFRWSLARYPTLMPEHQDFVRFGQLWMANNDL